MTRHRPTLVVVLCLLVAALSAPSGCAGTEECRGEPVGAVEAASLVDLMQRPADWEGRLVQLEGTADVMTTMCNTMVCNCCRQCAARVSLRQSGARVEVSNLDCSLDQCGGSCLLESWDRALGSLEGVFHQDPFTVRGVLKQVASEVSPVGFEYVFEVDGYCVLPSE